MRTDLLLDESGDLQEDAETLDFIEGDSDQQHVELMIISTKGEWKESPVCGFGIARRLKSVVDTVKFERDLNVELDNDGYTDASINIGNNIEDFKIELPS